MSLLPAPGPTRVLAFATLVNTFGNGLFMAGSALFFTRSVGLSVGQVGLGLTVAGLLGLLAGVPAGHLADRRGAREVLVALHVAQAAAMAAFAVVGSFGAFVVVATVFTVLDRASSAVRQGLVAAALPAEQRVEGRAYLRAVTNLGISGGAALAGLALAADSRPAYLALVLGDAASSLVAGAVLLRLPPGVRRTAVETGSMVQALRDRPYVVVTAMSAVLGIHYALLEVAVPLWVVRHTSAPVAVVALLFLVNTACCVLLQVRVSRAARDVATSAVAVRRGGLLLGASCLVFAASTLGPAPVAVVVLVLAALVNVAGELFQAAGSWGIGFGLAPEHAQGQYQGLYATGFAAASGLGPLVVTATAVQGVWGWALLGAVLAAAGVATVPVVAWAQRQREGVPA
ncbi:MAG: transporter [Frankiales bacterium]|nr:transporter [Frankiales bacterium]